MYILLRSIILMWDIVNIFSVYGRKEVLLVRNISLLYVVCNSVESLVLVAVLWQ